ncbi:hypothetical protein DASC09_025250 [Saccharomycopsis crataegensis]|uniref:Uncharacterized protein n=1 Tax=Saccharomycopsis crataegensis TaxID=43959 RepID=A0AAV5QJS2_9ASCO|nr:hypothetical protein DASC09_025250 [Saccharomycopsis crataegensis]
MMDEKKLEAGTKLEDNDALFSNQEDVFNLDESLNLPTYEVNQFDTAKHPNKRSSLDGNFRKDSLTKKKLVADNDNTIQELPQEEKTEPYDDHFVIPETVANAKEHNYLNVFSKPFRRFSSKHVSKSFYVFIGFSVLSTILILPFQVFIIYNSAHSFKFEGNSMYPVFQRQALTVGSAMLIFARVYQIFMSLNALITKNTIQALYVLVFLVSVFASSVSYMCNFPKELGVAPKGDTILVKFSSYWIIALSGLTIVAQVILFVWKLGKELSWERFKSMNSSMSTRSMVLVVQNYKALLIVNGFFIVYDLVMSINFPYKTIQKSYDALSIIAMILIGLTVLVLTYLYFAVDRKSITALKLGNFYMLITFIITSTSGYMLPTLTSLYYYDPTVKDNGSNSYISRSSEYVETMYYFRGAFAPFHYLFLIFNFMVSVYLISLFYKEKNPKSLQWWKKSGTSNLPTDNNKADEKEELALKVGQLLLGNIILSCVASILGIGFMSYIYTVRKKFLLSWYLVSIISIFAILGISIATYICFVRSGDHKYPKYLQILKNSQKSSKSQTICLHSLTKIKCLFAASVTIAFILLNGAVYFMFNIANFCQYYGFAQLSTINSVPESETYAVYVLKYLITFHQYPLDPESYEGPREQLELYFTDVYEPILEALLPMGKGKPSAIAILMCFVAFILLFKQSLDYSKLLYFSERLSELNQKCVTNITPEENKDVEPVASGISSNASVEDTEKVSTVTKLVIQLSALAYFNLYFIAVVLLMYATFPLDYWTTNYFTPMKDVNPTLIAIGVIHIAYIVIMAVFLISVSYLRNKNHESVDKKRTLTKIMALWFVGSGIIWIPMICYQVYRVFKIYTTVYSTNIDNLLLFPPVFAGLIAQLVTFLAVIVGGGILWWKIKKEGTKYEVM